MAEPRLTVRSAKARELAHRLALREKRSIVEIVERALEAYERASEAHEIRHADREPASAFYARLSVEYGTDIDLDAVVRAGRPGSR